MIDISQFNKSREKSFFQQRQLLKKVLAGKGVKCETCDKPLVVKATATGFDVTCPKGCTDLKLDV